MTNYGWYELDLNFKRLKIIWYIVFIGMISTKFWTSYIKWIGSPSQIISILLYYLSNWAIESSLQLLVNFFPEAEFFKGNVNAIFFIHSMCSSNYMPEIPNETEITLVIGKYLLEMIYIQDVLWWHSRIWNLDFSHWKLTCTFSWLCVSLNMELSF